MSASFIDGNPESKATFSARTQAPPQPPSLSGNLTAPVGLGGTVEGVLFGVLHKAVSGLISAYIANTSEDMTTISAKVKASAAQYKATDLINSIELGTSTVKLAEKGIGLAKTLSGSGSSGSSGSGSSGSGGSSGHSSGGATTGSAGSTGTGPTTAGAQSAADALQSIVHKGVTA
ncbi:hypothetical protein [Amycolatopsis taiwanensis]|uniref:Uncharacterized protein n=1 Tax=Amycolatopsis taiwanensis TaxID=342230 RepID=A0A9W6VAT8_9PSEU|nr:hypothetical protein [Amycolatopsis taiwanensis]GLY64178.1 hypothetical protein Atai01_07970 [Amycolatopsis taiwanensis]